MTALNTGQPPVVDLSDDELFGQPWSSINFGWISAHLAGIDLRGADLVASRWSNESDLSHSYLQCADLEDADFQGAYLNYADLRGANVQGADFRGAHLMGAKIAQLYGIAKWSSQPRGITIHPVQAWDQGSRLQDSSYWDGYPASTSPHGK